jgi:predicted MFS family arabinose efflux permease
MLSRVFIFLTYASAGTILALFPKLGDALHFGKPLVSRVLAFFYIGQLLSFFILAKTSRWHYNLRLLLVAQGLCAVAFLTAFVWNRTDVFSGAFGLIGLGAGLSYFSSLYYTLHEPVFRTSLAGVHEAILAAGRLVGPLSLGVVASRFNLKTPYLCLAIIFALYFGFTCLASRRLKRGVSPPAPLV